MDLTSTPRFAPGCRLHPTEHMLLVPEGALKLQGPARDILLLIDRRRTVAVIIDELVQQYSDMDAAALRQDVLDLLERMALRGVVKS